MPLDNFRLTAWRHHLHAHPELSRQERATAAYVCEQLAAMGVAHESGIGGHGVAATLSRPGSNRAVALRADMDALPIVEATGKPYASTNPGVMHACGHDGHTASLLGAAALLLEDPAWTGTIQLIFQPAEEGFNGAHAMLADGLLERFPFDAIYGYHNWPGLAAGTVMIHDGPVMAAAANFEIALTGTPGHAAMPNYCADPVQGLAALITALNTVVSRNTDPLDSAVISVCTLRAGQANNQIPEIAACGGTFRALTVAGMAAVESRMRALASGIAAAHGLCEQVTVHGNLAPTVNDSASAAIAAAAAATLGVPVRRDMRPTMGAEDFGRFLADRPGAYAWIGNGVSSANLHHPEFDYNDDILPIAARYLAATAKAALS
jgi:hippurate hydrolase